jgi:hypothetical protein
MRPQMLQVLASATCDIQQCGCTGTALFNQRMKLPRGCGIVLEVIERVVKLG